MDRSLIFYFLFSLSLPQITINGKEGIEREKTNRERESEERGECERERERPRNFIFRRTGGEREEGDFVKTHHT